MRIDEGLPESDRVGAPAQPDVRDGEPKQDQSTRDAKDFFII